MKKILKSNLCLSCCLTLIMFLLTLSISSFRCLYETNDDFGISLFIANGYDKCLYVSYFITVVLVPLQRIFTTFNVWMLSQLLLNFLSIIVIVYIFLAKFERKQAIFFSVLLNMVNDYFCFVSLQYTRSAAIIATAGYLLILWSCSSEKWTKCRFLTGFLLVLVSSFYRFYAFLSVSGVFFVFVLTLIFTEILKTWKEKTTFSYLSLLKTMLFIAVAFIVAFSAEQVSNSIKSNDKGYLYHLQYQMSRSDCVDILISPYQGNEKFYHSIGIGSENDLKTLTSWTGDEEFFTVARMKAIAEYSKKDSSFFPNFKDSVMMIHAIIAGKLGSMYRIIIIKSLLAQCC